jgi:quercetin 2,3-dioxygenase
MTTPTLSPQVDVRRADERFTTQIGWLDSKHSFSFGSHYDHDNTHHGLLLVNNDDVVTPGFGFETHPHRDMEIVTWVMQGSLVHQDSTGHNGVIYPGLAQRMSAGTGILHSEKNDSWRLQGGDAHRDPVHFVQMWVLPDEGGITPATSSSRSTTRCSSAGSSRWPPAWPSTAAPPPSASATGTPPCTPPGCSPVGPSSCPRPRTCTCSSRGTVTLEGAGELRTGDAVRFTATGGQRVTATEAAEVLVWEMHATVAA